MPQRLISNPYLNKARTEVKIKIPEGMKINHSDKLGRNTPIHVLTNNTDLAKIRMKSFVSQITSL